MKCLAGKVYDGEGFRDGYALVEGGKTVEIGEGKAPYVPDAVGVVIPRMVDGHTHCADITTDGNITLINGGSMSYSYLGERSYCYVVIDKKNIIAKIVKIA